MISIIIPCFNHGRFLPEAIASVETSFPFEIILVNDGSTDAETLNLLDSLVGKLKVIHQENKGAAAARNAAISLAKGKYIVPLDADNQLCPALFTQGIAFLEENPGIDVVYGDNEVFGERRGFSLNKPFHIPYFLYHHHIDTCSVFRKSIWEKAGGYDEKMPYKTQEDWGFFLDVAKVGGRFHYIDQTFFRYRYRKDSNIRTFNSRAEVRYSMALYLLKKKEQVLDLAQREMRIAEKDVRKLKIRWKWAIAFHAFQAGNFRVLFKSIVEVWRKEPVLFSGVQLFRMLIHRAGFRDDLQKAAFLLCFYFPG